MAKYKHYECVECEGVFNLKHDMQSDYYDIKFCAFCGADLDSDQEDDIEEDDTY